jgi:hypothetical protein
MAHFFVASDDLFLILKSACLCYVFLHNTTPVRFRGLKPHNCCYFCFVLVDIIMMAIFFT